MTELKLPLYDNEGEMITYTIHVDAIKGYSTEIKGNQDEGFVVIMTKLDSSTPIEPGTPTDPSTPIEPGNPTDPSTPIEPGNPTDPSTPIEPGTPENPSTSNKPDGDSGMLPLQPEDDESKDKGDNLPLTGAPSRLAFSALATGLSSLFLFLSKKRKNKM